MTLRSKVRHAPKAAPRVEDWFEETLAVMLLHDFNGRLVRVNPATAYALGRPAAELQGCFFSDFVPASQKPLFEGYLARVRSNGRDAGRGYITGRENGEYVWEYRSRVVRRASDESQVLVCAIDVSDRRRFERNLFESSRTDPLTGCYNRRYLEQVEGNAGPDDRWACVVLDLDRFKAFNDEHGHGAGDRALTATVDFLTRLVADGDAVVRLGGDEFLLLLPSSGKDGLTAFLTRLEHRRDTEAPIRFSFGSAIRKGEETLTQTIDRADAELISYRRRRGMRRA